MLKVTAIMISVRRLSCRENLHSKEVLKRITSLRTQFTRLIKLPPSGSAAKKLTARQEWMFKNLEFLRPFVKKRDSISNMDESVVDEDDDDEGGGDEENNDVEQHDAVDDPTDMSDLASQADDVSAKSTKRPLPRVARKTSKKGKKDTEGLEVEVLKNMSEGLKSLQAKPVPEDDVDVFCKNVARKLRLFKDAKTKFVVEDEIDSVISRHLMHSWNSSASATMPSSHQGYYQNNNNSNNNFSSNQLHQYDNSSSEQSFTHMLNL